MRRLRTVYPNPGKARLQALLAPWCETQDERLPSVSTPGRIIARAPDNMRSTPQRLSPKGRPQPVKHKAKPRQPKGTTPPLVRWAVDTLVRVRDGMRRRLIPFIDPHRRIAFALAIPSKHSHHTAQALKALKHGMTPLRAILSDNGSEFMGDFEKACKHLKLTHYRTCPRSPKMNAHNERFNRTVRESFVDFHEDLLFSDLTLFNRKLADWLIDYNTVLPHHGLHLKSPVQWLLEYQPECQRYWTNTKFDTCAATGYSGSDSCM